MVENNDLKILIDALKYTSNLIVDITDKLTEQDKKIDKLEKTIISIQNTLRTLNTIQNSNTSKINAKLNHKHNEEELKSFIIEKKNTQSKNVNNDINTNNTNYTNNTKIGQSEIYLGENNFENKNRIDKLISSIVKKKKMLNDEINDEKNLLGEKSLLTDYNLTQQDNKTNLSSGIDFTIKTANQNNSKTLNDMEKETKQTQEAKEIVNTLKNIRKKTNFARRL